MTELKLSNSDKVVLIDDEDFEKVSQFNWALTPQGYARRGMRKGKGIQTKIYLHRFIMNAPDGKDVDHKNRNKLDCQKSNMRIVTRLVNLLNKGMLKNNTSGVKGVWWNNGKWCAAIEIQKKRIYLGRFTSKMEAAKVRKEAEKKYHECYLV